MRRDFRIPSFRQCLPEIAFRGIEISHPEVGPAHAVHDEWILGIELVRALDQREALGGALRSVDERVSERVECLRVVRVQSDELGKAGLGDIELVELFGDHCDVVEELGLIGLLDQCLGQYLERTLVVAGVAQKLRFGLAHLDPLLDGHRGQIREIAARLRHAVLFREHRRRA